MTKKITEKLCSLFSALVLLFGLLAAIPGNTSTARATSFTISATFKNQNSADAALKTLRVDNTVLSADTASGVIKTTVNNKSDSAFVLPSTGGMGRYIFLGLGALVVVLAIAAPSLKKKHEN